MKKNILLLWLFCIFVAEFVLAGGHIISTGGNVLICENNGVKTLTTYDLVEGDALFGLSPVYSEKTDYFEKATDIISRLQILNPTRAHLYLKWLGTFKNESHFLPEGFRLIGIPDLGLGVLPPNCHLEQTIVQSSAPGYGEFRYTINSDVWSALDDNQKAALVIHEIIYREAILPENQHQNSGYVRQLNQLLHADRLRTMRLRSYIEFLRTHQFALADAHGVAIQLFMRDSENQEIISNPVEYIDYDSIASATMYWNGIFKHDQIEIQYSANTSSQQSYFFNSDKVYFYPNHQIKEVHLPVGSVDNFVKEDSNYRLDLNLFGINGEMWVNFLSFTVDGVLQEASFRYWGEYGTFLYLQEDKSRLKFGVNLNLAGFKIPMDESVITLRPELGLLFNSAVCQSQSKDFFFFNFENPRILEKHVIKKILFKSSISNKDLIFEYCK